MISKEEEQMFESVYKECDGTACSAPSSGSTCASNFSGQVPEHMLGKPVQVNKKEEDEKSI